MKNIFNKLIAIVREPWEGGLTYLGLFRFKIPKPDTELKYHYHIIVHSEIDWDYNGSFIKPYLYIEVCKYYPIPEIYRIPLWFWTKNHKKSMEIQDELMKVKANCKLSP